MMRCLVLLCACCLCASAGSAGYEPFASLRVAEREIEIDLKKPVRLLHVSDSHVVRIDSRDTAELRDFVLSRSRLGRELGEHYLDEALAYARQRGMPLVHTGDLVACCGVACLEYAGRFLRADDVVACVGNHEYWLSGALRNVESNRVACAERLSEAFPGHPVRVHRLDGLTLFAFDNASGLVAPAVAEAFERVVAEGRPIVMACHVPLDSPDLKAIAWCSCGTDACTDAPTVRFVERVRREPLVKAVLAGHVHGEHVGRFSPTAMEYVSGALFNGEAQVISFLPRRTNVVAQTRFFVNADNDHYFRRRGPELMTREAMRAYLDDVAQGGRVTDFVMCTMGQRASYDSKACEPIWLGAGEAGADRWVSNAKLCQGRGLDLYAVWIERCREKGIVPWISMRMNDVHGVTGREWFRTCGFWRNHPEFRRHPELDPLKGGGGWLNFTLDYGRSEVRDYHLAIFRELVDRYDADGYELDWMRWPCCLRVGREREDAHFITDFMRACRTIANAASVLRGHPVRLSVRVPQKIVCAEGFGLDPIGWAREGLVDLIVPTCFIQAYDYELDWAGWKAAVASVNPRVEVIPGGANLFSASDYDGTVPFEHSAWCGWCDRMFVQGARGIYLFNADYLAPAVRDEVYLKGMDPELAAGAPRRYLSSFDDITSVEGTLGQRCPFSAQAGKAIVISGGTAPTSGVVAVTLALSETGAAPQVELNGMAACAAPRRLDGTEPYCAKRAKEAWRWHFAHQAFRTGPNIVKVLPNPSASVSNEVVWCELSIGL